MLQNQGKIIIFSLVLFKSMTSMQFQSVEEVYDSSNFCQL